MVEPSVREGLAMMGSFLMVVEVDGRPPSQTQRLMPRAPTF